MKLFNITELVDSVKPCTLNFYRRDGLDCFYIQADNGHGYHLGFNTDKDYTDTYLPTLKNAAEYVLSLNPILPDHDSPTEFKFTANFGGFELPYAPGTANYWGKEQNLDYIFGAPNEKSRGPSMLEFWPEYFGVHKYQLRKDI